MSEDEDLDLLALQRQLDDAFQTTRPRPAFEDELWLRMQARRPIWLRFREGLAGLIEGIREAPAVPSAAVAIALVVLVGAGIFTMGGLRPSGSPTSLQAGSDRGTTTSQPNIPNLGPLPRFPGTIAGAPNPAVGGSAIYAGPANLVWAGSLNVTAAAVPVYRYLEPTKADADKFAASLGTTTSTDVAQDALGVYAGKSFTLVVFGSIAQPAREPHFNVSDRKSTTTSGSDSVAVATAFLAAHHLLPTWPYQTQVQTLGGTTVRVSFLRSFALPDQGQASLVDTSGNRYGTEVDFAPGTPGAFESGPLPLSLEAATYPIISADQAIRSLGASSAPAGSSIPVVRITQAELVYTLVLAGVNSYYEPAFMFSGTFNNQGVTTVKRVLIPAVNPVYFSP